MPRKKDVVEVEEIEEKELEEEVVANIADGQTGIGGEFLSLGINETVVPRDTYDYVVFVVKDNPGYPLATAAARAYGALKRDGKMIIDFNGITYDEENILAQLGFLQFKHEKTNKGHIILVK